MWAIVDAVDQGSKNEIAGISLAFSFYFPWIYTQGIDYLHLCCFWFSLSGVSACIMTVLIYIPTNSANKCFKNDKLAKLPNPIF